MSNQIEIARQNAANADLRTAKRRGCVLICNTLKGTVSLTCDVDGLDGVYVLATNGEVLATGKARDVRPVLAAVYDVSEPDAIDLGAEHPFGTD
jgi:hypothetical protein